MSSSTDEAIDADEPVFDGVPRAPDVVRPAARASPTLCCVKMGRKPEPPLIIDLAALPEPLPPAEARRILPRRGRARGGRSRR